jgi:hypothetical protein
MIRSPFQYNTQQSSNRQCNAVPSKPETVDSEPTLAAAAFRSRPVALGTVAGNC